MRRLHRLLLRGCCCEKLFFFPSSGGVGGGGTAAPAVLVGTRSEAASRQDWTSKMAASTLAGWFDANVLRGFSGKLA